MGKQSNLRYLFEKVTLLVTWKK